MVSSARLRELWKDPAYRANQMAERRKRFNESEEYRKNVLKHLETIRNGHLEQVRRFKQAASNKHRGAEIRGGYIPLPYKELYNLFRKTFSARKAYKMIKILRQIIDAK